MVNIRFLVKAIGAVLLLGVALFIYQVSLSRAAFKSRKNLENFRRLKVGMTKAEMLKIMGEPDNVQNVNFWPGNYSRYFYRPPFMSDGGIDVYIDSIDRVAMLHFK